MTVTISPNQATIDAADKPYYADFSAEVDFVPKSYQWYFDNVAHYQNNTYSGSGPYTILGPEDVLFSALPKEAKVIVTKLDDSTEEDSFTTADQRPTPSITIETLTQEEGVAIESLVSQPMPPTIIPVPNQNQVHVIWGTGASGQAPRSYATVRFHAEDQISYLDQIEVNWGDGETGAIDTYGFSEAMMDESHSYSSAATYTVEATGRNLIGGVSAAATGTITATADATGWRATQYQIRYYQDQLGYRDRPLVSWREIGGDSSDLDFVAYGISRAHSYYFYVQLRETDSTGRVVVTSAFSDTTSVDPW